MYSNESNLYIYLSEGGDPPFVSQIQDEFSMQQHQCSFPLLSSQQSLGYFAPPRSAPGTQLFCLWLQQSLAVLLYTSKCLASFICAFSVPKKLDEGQIAKEARPPVTVNWIALWIQAN